MSWNKQYIFRAGMIPYFYDGVEVKMLFMKPSDTTYGGDCYQIAKGKVEEGETPQECAMREVQEETGVRMENVVSIDFIDTVMGRTDLFICKLWTDDQEEFDEPSEETESTRWMTMEEFKKEGRQIHIGSVKMAYDRICLIENLE